MNFDLSVSEVMVGKTMVPGKGVIMGLVMVGEEEEVEPGTDRGAMRW